MGEVSLVVGIGEVLWDVFPNGKKLGGAPLNFSYHCGPSGRIPKARKYARFLHRKTSSICMCNRTPRIRRGESM